MLNNVCLIGNITKDVELKNTGNTSFANFNLAVARNFKNQNGEYESDFINCIAFNKTAELIANSLRKGSKVGIAGRLQTRNYENQAGQRVYVTEVIVNDVSFLEKKQDNRDPYANQYQQVAEFISDEDLPF